MLAKECDRCGRLYHPYEEEHTRCNAIRRCGIDKCGRSFKEDDPKDLCPKCLNSFYDWFSQEKTD